MKKINYFGNTSPESLAKELIKYPELYTLHSGMFRRGSELEIVSSDINIKSSLRTLDKANKIASSGRVFGFEFESACLESECFCLYKLIDNELVDFGDTLMREADLGYVLGVLKHEKIKQLFTGRISNRGYCGIKHTPRDEDGYWSNHNPLGEISIDRIEKSDVEVVDLGDLRE